MLTRALFLLLVAGCTSLPEKPPVPPQTVTVNKPVTVYKKCPVTMPEAPLWCVPGDDSDVEWLRCELADMKLARPYIRELETALRLCAE